MNFTRVAIALILVALLLYGLWTTDKPHAVLNGSGGGAEGAEVKRAVGIH